MRRRRKSRPGRCLPRQGGGQARQRLDAPDAFYDFPAKHAQHAIESSFATVKLRTRVTKGAGSKKAALAIRVTDDQPQRPTFKPPDTDSGTPDSTATSTAAARNAAGDRQSLSVVCAAGRPGVRCEDMFGRGWEPAEATILASRVKSTTGDGMVSIREFVAEIRPTAAPPFRTTLQEPRIAMRTSGRPRSERSLPCTSTSNVSGRSSTRRPGDQREGTHRGKRRSLQGDARRSVGARPTCCMSPKPSRASWRERRTGASRGDQDARRHRRGRDSRRAWTTACCR